MTKPLPKRDVEIGVRRTGPPRLTSAERQQLESVQDPTLKKIMGEIFLTARANQENFDEISQWFPIQPEDASNSLREGAEYSGEGEENESEADESRFWLRWLRGLRVTQIIRGFFAESGADKFHVLRLQSKAEPDNAEHTSYLQVYAYDNDKRTGVVVVAGGNSLYILRKEADGSTYTDFLGRFNLFAKGDLISASAAQTPARIAVGEDGKILVADSSTLTGLKWKTAKEAAAEGPEGRSAGLKFTYSTNTEETDPGAGKLKFNKAALAEATSLRISETDGDANAIAAYLATLDDSTNAVKGHLVLRKVAAPTVFAVFSVTGALVDKGTWDTLAVTHLVSNGLANNDVVTVEFFRVGDAGEKGAAGAEGKEGKEGPEGTRGADAIHCTHATNAALPANTRTVNVLEANANGELEVDAEKVKLGNTVLVKNEGTGANNGVYEVLSVGSGASKWKLSRIAAFDTSGELVAGTLITIVGGTFNRRRIYVLVTSGATINVTALTFVTFEPKDFGLVAVLPTEALVGDLCTFKAEAGNALWQFVYDGEGEFPWKKVGGPALFATTDADETRKLNSYADLTTKGPSLTAPLKGDYRVAIGAQGYSPLAALVQSIMSYEVGATAPKDADGARFDTTAANMSETGTMQRTKAGVAAGTVITAKYKSFSANEARWLSRWMEIDPVRVG